MKTPDIRVPQKPFIDRQHFPYGFKKSGDFSITEANLLSQYGKTLAGLESGELTPETADETHFVAMLKGEEAAENSLEKAWAVMDTPLRSEVQAPETSITNAVMEQTRIVSMNGPSMATKPSRTGSVVLAAPWARASVPSPASFENTARLIP